MNKSYIRLFLSAPYDPEELYQRTDLGCAEEVMEGIQDRKDPEGQAKDEGVRNKNKDFTGRVGR